MLSKLPIQTVGGQQVFDLEIGKPTNDQMGQLDDERRVVPPGAVGRVGPEQGPRRQEGDRDARDRAREGARPTRSSTWRSSPRTARSTSTCTSAGTTTTTSTSSTARRSSPGCRTRASSAPVAELGHADEDTAAFTKTDDRGRQHVTVEVRIFFGKPGTETDPDTDAGGKVLEDMRASLKSATSSSTPVTPARSTASRSRTGTRPTRATSTTARCADRAAVASTRSSSPRAATRT